MRPRSEFAAAAPDDIDDADYPGAPALERNDRGPLNSGPTLAWVHDMHLSD